jgi:catechol 2,3-dioxygenase-like lactoylglutathione lyase family enzyme
MTNQGGHLHHVELYVSDLQRSLHFWGSLLGQLGYERYQQWEAGESWKLGPTYVVFVQVTDAFREPTYDRRRVGLNHLAFHAQSREDVDRLAEELEARGTRFLYTDHYPSDDYYAIYFEDPDGIKVEVVAPEIQ